MTKPATHSRESDVQEKSGCNTAYLKAVNYLTENRSIMDDWQVPTHSPAIFVLYFQVVNPLTTNVPPIQKPVS